MAALKISIRIEGEIKSISIPESIIKFWKDWDKSNPKTDKKIAENIRKNLGKIIKLNIRNAKRLNDNEYIENLKCENSAYFQYIILEIIEKEIYINSREHKFEIENTLCEL